MVKVSILVPVYNVEKYITQCLESILQQTLKEIEIICVDDGSTDLSAKILDDYASKDNRIKVLHKENTGYGDSMNRALEIAQGEYIGIIESDDFIEKDMYERLYAVAREKEVDFLKSDYYRYDNGKKVCDKAYDSTVYGKVFENKGVMKKFDNTTMAIWSGLYKTNFLKTNNIRFLPTSGASYQDISFMFKVYVCARKGYILNEAYVNYRVDNEASSVKSQEKVYCVCDEIAECKRFLECRQDGDIFAPYLTKIMFYIYRWNMYRISAKYISEFIFCISKELKQRKQNGVIDQNLFSSDEWMQYVLISECTEKYMQILLQERLEKEVKNNIIYEDGYRKKFQSCNDMYIYGAGKIGKRLEKYIKSIHKNSNISYVVSDKVSSTEGDYLEITDTRLNTRYPVFVAVLNLVDKAEMISNAKKRGFREIYSVDATLLKLI